MHYDPYSEEAFRDPYAIYKRLRAEKPAYYMEKYDAFGGADQDAAFVSLTIARIGRPEEIALLVLFLASDEAPYTTGAEVSADGGRMAGHRDPGLGS